jgi:hypothetical protein
VATVAVIAAALVLAASISAAPLIARPSLARARQATPHCGVVVPMSFVRVLQKSFPHQRVTASVDDTMTGCRYHLHRRMLITTASIVKAQVLGAVLLRAQDQHRGLDRYEKARIHPMIRYSLNDPYVSDLYELVGGVAGMNAFDRRMHATHTTNSLEYGATITTAADRTKISLRMLHGGGPLRRPARKTAWHYMSHVHPTQRWGITAGLPRGWSVAQKNGFYPMTGHGWRVGSTGFVRAPGSNQGYAITVMTDQNTSQFAGIRLVERVARKIAAALTDGPPAQRLVDRARCVETHAGESWPTVARKVGMPVSQWPKVRLVSGGNPYPLAGQRACSPHLKPTHQAM